LIRERSRANVSQTVSQASHGSPEPGDASKSVACIQPTRRSRNFASAVILYFASNLRSLLGERGLTALERLMGMLLVVVAVQMLIRGAADYLRVRRALEAYRGG
jgi:MarC family integral membrane protein